MKLIPVEKKKPEPKQKVEAQNDPYKTINKAVIELKQLLSQSTLTTLELATKNTELVKNVIFELSKRQKIEVKNEVIVPTVKQEYYDIERNGRGQLTRIVKTVVEISE